MNATTPPDWAHCGDCRGVRAAGRASCLAHLERPQQDAYMGSLRPGDDIDLRGTVIDADLLERLLAALLDPAEGRIRIGTARFDEATFTGKASFERAAVAGEAHFRGATFTQDVAFKGAEFARPADFIQARFEQDADFDGASFGDSLTFHGAAFAKRAMFSRASFAQSAYFNWATFDENAWFAFTTFEAEAGFGDAVFGGTAGFAEARFAGKADFARASFRATHSLGSFTCDGTVDLSHAGFTEPVTIEAAAARVICERTRWESTATLRLRGATLDLTDAVLVQPVAVTAHPAQSPGVSVASLRGVDCAMLTLADVDLTTCRFAGAFHLDQLRLEGRWTFNSPPPHRIWRWGIPYSWTQRQVLEEERQWRALPTRPRALRRGWGDPPASPHEVPGLATLTIVYRQLRKAREDAKDEPGAADFYYGEMEMRRHSHRPRQAERWLLQAYWLLSGYGLRASRALAWLLLAMMATVMLMMGFGIPQDSTKQEVTRVYADGRWKTVIDKPDPKNPTGDRFTGKRLDKAVTVTLNSVVFRSSGQDLTTAGAYIEMISRITEPVLLGLAVLAVRGRVKR
ncbi:pentapeptide repeat-containing protein [Streptomyces sp. NPDC000410]|uniref:pentapeptide repeat-containing protein n=1 Tax=Streptomyces sp. NPDC000410 TaxID=3154254 RepID=UPI0033310C24